MKKPVIGISASYVRHNEIMEGVYVHHDYHRAIVRAGGVPIVLPITDTKTVDSFLTLCDGILFSGGEDVDPRFYNRPPAQNLGFTYPERDEVEIYMLREAMKQNKPVFGICRGLQLINVALGGSLVQDIPSEVENAIQHVQKVKRQKASHEVMIEESSKLFKIIGKENVFVNSLHHQSIKNLAPELKAVAYSIHDHIIEAVEHESYGKLLGVQWHPESLSYTEEDMQRLFDAFVASCK